MDAEANISTRDSALLATGVTKRFGKVTALSDAQLSVRRNEIHGLIGPNGSGKSTFLHVIAGRTLADAGTLKLDGVNLTRKSPAARARLGLSIKFQHPRIYRDQSVAENLLLACQSRSSIASLMLSASRRGLQADVDQTAADFGLTRRRDDLAGTLSHGEQQWLEIAMAMATRPKLLLLDEPTGGMNRSERERTGTVIRAAADRCSVVIVEHDLDFVGDLCDRITLLHQGTHIATGTPAEVRNDERAQEVYLSRV